MDMCLSGVLWLGRGLGEVRRTIVVIEPDPDFELTKSANEVTGDTSADASSRELSS